MNAEEASGPREDPGVDDSGIGERVSAVFTAAEKAAQHILTMAREEGDDIRRQARAEADVLTRQFRVEAEREAERILMDVGVQAESMLEEARAAGRKIEDDARIRKERLQEEMRLLEERIHWAQDGLREVVSRLRLRDDEGEPPESRLAAQRIRVQNDGSRPYFIQYECSLRPCLAPPIAQATRPHSEASS